MEEILLDLEIFFLPLFWLGSHPPPTRKVGHREELAWILENLWQLTDTQDSIRFIHGVKKKCCL